MAPEVLRGEGYSLRSDVYSFGMLLHELASLHKRKESKKISMENLSDVMDGCATSSKLSLTKIPCKFVASLIEDCLSESPKVRPSFEAIVKTLQSILGASSTTTLLSLKPFTMSETDAPPPFKPSAYPE